MGCFALLANDLTHITLGNFEFKYNRLATFNLSNPYLFRVVDQCLYNLKLSYLFLLDNLHNYMISMLL